MMQHRKMSWELITLIYKELFQINRKKMTNQLEKRAKDMNEKFMERYSISHVLMYIKEIQTKTQHACHFKKST